jgi:hypothetical protein
MLAGEYIASLYLGINVRNLSTRVKLKYLKPG